MRRVVVVGAARSAVGKKQGALAQTHPIDLLGPVQRGALDRAGVDPASVGQVVGGCIAQVGAQSGNIIRTAWLAAGLPLEVPCFTIDSACGSSQQAVNLGAALVRSGAEDVVVACGVENMSMVPIGSNAQDGIRAGHGKPINRSYVSRYENTSQFEGAERIAEKYGLTRRDTDLFAVESQRRAASALAAGVFDDQIVEIQATRVDQDGSRLDSVSFRVDECARSTTLEGLTGLAPVARPDGVHTAGSSSQIADGAAALVLMAAEPAAALGLPARAEVLDSCLVGCDPVLMLEGPIPATRRLLDRQGMTMADVDVVEINEAFASVVLAWAEEFKPDMDRVNPNGGAIALGHPLGATGCLLVVKALHELERRGQEVGLVTMCCGGGLGTGTLIRRL